MSHIADALQLVAQAGPSVPRPRLSEAVGLVEKQIRHQIRSAQDSSESEQLSDMQESNLKGRISQILVHHPPEQSKTTRSTLPSPSKSGSQFWKSFFQTSHLLVPNTLQTSDHETSGMAMSTIKSQPIAYATTSFTQRLFSACAKSGYRYLTSDMVTDQAMWPEFGLMLQSLPRSEIISYFHRVVTTVPCNPIEDSRFPFISLGGAGAHFQAQHTRNGAPSFQSLQALRITNGIVEVPCNEEWFDVHDVEGFLIARGFQLRDTVQTPPNGGFENAGSPEGTPFPIVDIATSSHHLISHQANPELSSVAIDEDALIEGEYCHAADEYP